MDFITEAFVDTGRLLPLLALIYFLVAILEYRYEGRMGHFIIRLGAWGPVAGALFGCLPQCGFSVIAAALYLKRMVSVGTLLAVFLSTSDEAVPVLLTVPGKAHMVWILIAIKVVIAFLAGTAIDFFLNKRTGADRTGNKHTDKCYQAALDEHKGCCSHSLHDRPSKMKALFWHPLTHTVKIYIFLLILSILLGFAIKTAGEVMICKILLNGSVLQPAIAAFIGLIPNCFASVLLAKLYASGTLSFGSLVSGLCAGTGLGLLVLIKESKDLKDALRITALLLAISISVGVIIQSVQSLF